MATLKIRIKIGKVEIELEGDQEIVKKQFQELKQNGVGNLISQSATPNSGSQKDKTQSERPKTEKKPNRVLKSKEKSTEGKAKSRGKTPG